MITLLISIVCLVVGYLIYGKFVEKVFGPDPNAKTPAYTKQDGIDYIPMPTWKVFMIQFLNIAGTGPIFGAIMGAMFGPSCYLWIVLGCIFGGAVHDYFTGMLSIRGGGENVPSIVGRELGGGTKKVMLVFSVVMLILVGTVFVYSPAQILGPMTHPASWFGITGDFAPVFSKMFWVVVILIYYIVATLLPVDKVIGRFYPIFAFSLLFMAVSLFVCLLVKWPVGMPEVWDGLQNRAPASGSIFPCLFITIACGAVSGFHSTQSPLMARCLTNEKLGRPVFYGAMITEGIVALIWAAVSSWFFFAGGKEILGVAGSSAPVVVTEVSKGWLGIVGGILAILGVVAAPITSGDTALRSARLIFADAFKLDQAPVRNRLYISIPIFVATGLLLWYNIADENGFNVIWRYFGWANQTLAVFVLWTVTAFLSRHRKGVSYLMTLLPAAFMTSVTVTFILTAKIGFNLPTDWTAVIGITTGVLSLALFYYARMRRLRRSAS